MEQEEVTVRGKREKQPKDAEVSEVGSDDSEGEDPDFVDSDCELDDGDDDLFVDNVHENVVDEGVAKGQKIANGKKAKGSSLKVTETVNTKSGEELSTDDEGLELPISDDEGEVTLKFKSSMEDDMNNQAFKVGLVFPSVQILRNAITESGVRNRVQI